MASLKPLSLAQWGTMKMIKVLETEIPIQDKGLLDTYLSKAPGKKRAFKKEPVNGMG
jgi:hypothetical protein